MYPIPAQELDLIVLARRVKTEGRVTVTCGSHNKAIRIRQEIYKLKEKIIKAALDFPDRYPPDTIDVLGGLSTQLPKHASDLVLTDGSWIDRAISEAAHGGTII